jgi:putative transposase
VVTATQQRAAADYLAKAYRISERRASRVLGRARSTVRYRPRPRSGEDQLIRAIRRLARRHRRYGYKRIHARLVHQGWQVNRKRVRRLWNALGLRLRKPRQKPKKGGQRPGTSANSCVRQPAGFKNDVWTYDFVAERTVDGRPLKWLTLVDEYTRECLALYVAHSVVGTDVRRVLARVIGRRGAPTRLRSDNGSEFIGEALQGWLPGAGTHSIPVAPGSPWENGYIESFNSRFRDEFLNGEEFETAADARAKGAWWRREYNTIRPHSSLGYQTPKAFSAECDRGQHGQRAASGSDKASTLVNGTPISGGPKNG